MPSERSSKSSKDSKSSRTRDRDAAKDSDHKREKRERDPEKERDRHRDDRDRERRRHDDRDRRDRKDKSERDDNHRDDKDRRRERDSDRRKEDKDRHRSDRDREGDKENRDDRHHRRDHESERRHRDDRDREHREDRHRDEKESHRDNRDREKHRDDRDKRNDDRDRRPKDDKDRDRHRDDKDRDRYRDDKDRERYRDEKDRDKHRGEKYRDRHRDSKDNDRSKDKDRDRDRRKDERERDRHRDEKERERDRERRRDDRDKDRDRHKDEKDREHHRSNNERHRDDRDRDRKDRHLADDDRHGKDKERSHHRSDRERSHHRDEKERSHRDKEDRKHDEERKRRSDRKIEEERESGSGDLRRDKSSDRKIREEESAERSTERHRDDRAKSSRNNRTPHTTKEPSTPAAKAEEEEGDDYGDYDEDFEEYDEDFEDFEDDEETDVKNMPYESNSNNKEVDDLFEAMNAENDRLLASSQRSLQSDMTDSSEDRRVVSNRPNTSRQRGFINFVAAKQRDMSMKTANAARKRCTELFKIIDLDTVSLSLFDLPPVKEYDLYMSSFGRTNAHQVAVQTRDDNLDRDIQTETIEYEEKWTQHPAEDRHGCGTGGDNKQEEDRTFKTDVDEGRLASFLLRSCQVIEKLISEEQSKSNLTQSSDSFSSSEAYATLRHCEILSERDVTSCKFSTADSNTLLTIHSKPNQPVEKMVDKYGIVAIWNVNDPSSPQKIAVSAGAPSCCCFSPNKATLLFSGMTDGSVAAWDLREPKTMHHSHICGGKDWLLRLPTYNTAGVMNDSSHTSPVTAIVSIVSDKNKSSLQDSGLGLSFQLATLEERGVINLWVVAEVIETSQAGSESDLGLSPKGKIKLLKSSTINLQNPNISDSGLDFCATSLQLNISNQNHFYVPTDSGVVIHGTRFGNQKTIPRSYSAYAGTPCDITSIDLHPKGHPILAAGTDSGVLYLYHLESDKPLLVWDSFTNGSRISKILWSRNCSYVLFVLDSNSVIHMWDLLRNDTEPMASDSLPSKRVKDIHLSDERISGLKPKMSITLDDGTVEVHVLSNHVSQLQPGEDEQFMRYIDQL